MTAYDVVPYSGHPYADSHPERLATMAALFGVPAAPVEGCRVLEIACGDGANLIPMAYALPGSTFTGFDLAAQPIAAGRNLAGRIGLTNISLTQCDLAAFPPDAGAFDYIIAHGLYSWIPAPVRDRLMALLARHLAPRGVAFVSYNVFPGCHVRRMVWDMLRFHIAPLESPGERIEEAQSLARLLAESRTGDDPYAQLLKSELARVTSRNPGFLFHDDLAEVNDPVYFHEFVAHAEKHRLQFLCEAELVAMASVGMTAQARRVLEVLDPLAREQYLDFIKCRRFRQTLLCRDDLPVDRKPGPDSLASLQLASRRRGLAGEPDAAEAAPATEALPRAILDALDAAAPLALTLEELAARLPGTDAGQLRQLCWAAANAGAVQLHVQAPKLSARPGERPEASAVARAQLAGGDNVTNLQHVVVNLDDASARELVALLDGTRDHAMLAAALKLPRDALESRLQHLAKLALLVA